MSDPILTGDEPTEPIIPVSDPVVLEVKPALELQEGAKVVAAVDITYNMLYDEDEPEQEEIAVHAGDAGEVIDYEMLGDDDSMPWYVAFEVGDWHWWCKPEWLTVTENE